MASAVSAQAGAQPPQTQASPEGDECPVCKSTRYMKPHLRLLVSLCYHKMCEDCINRLFLAGAAPCPICKTSLRKSNFVAQTFEDLRVEKEVHFRRKVGKFFNKRIEDFGGDEKAYDDYLEEVEDILFNLANDVDVQATTERVEKWRQENKTLITQNSARQQKEDRVIANRLKREQEEKLIRRDALKMHELEEARMKELEKQHLIEELATSDKTPEEIMAAFHRNRAQHTTANMDAILLNNANYQSHQEYYDDLDLQTTDLQDEDTDFDAFDHEYADPLEGFVLAPTYQDPWTMDVAVDPGARASGFLPQWSYTRAIMSSFYGVLEGIETSGSASGPVADVGNGDGGGGEAMAR
ncbi:CDK-activating kinase assembly factor MAT1-domain-containing protein [Chytriomyces sp. MP71]|nr:CDK-activating kinase assembly factor MAT1-domain-containing protein [Chytriomyces sp. MP71]